MISIEKCKIVLKHSVKKYTDEEIKQIRDLLYQIATIEYEKFKVDSEHKGNIVQKSIN